MAVGGSFGCQALPQLPDSASEQSVPSRLVAGAGTSLCAGALDWLRAEPTREVRLQLPAASASAGESVINFDVETRHSTASPVASGRLAGIELVVRDVRDLPLPHRATGAVTSTGRNGAEFVNDRRSGLADALDIVEASVVAADLAYDIQEQAQSDLRAIGHLDPETVSRELPGYIIQRLYVDSFSGLKAVALESRLSRHRIYAIAGTQVFVNRDYRDWASGLMMARPQFVSNASLLLA